jgi:hypothetical protein
MKNKPQRLNFPNMEYNDKLAEKCQLEVEKDIAGLIWGARDRKTGKVSEEFCTALGRQILEVVLARFRPDMFEEE